jgi:hypothetical protein
MTMQIFTPRHENLARRGDPIQSNILLYLLNFTGCILKNPNRETMMKMFSPLCNRDLIHAMNGGAEIHSIPRRTMGQRFTPFYEAWRRDSFRVMNDCTEILLHVINHSAEIHSAP